MTTYYRNESLFSEIYLQEITKQTEDTEILASLIKPHSLSSNTKRAVGRSVRINDNGLKRADYRAYFFQDDVVFMSS